MVRSLLVQWAAPAEQPVTVAVRVLKMLEVVSVGTGLAVASAAVTGQMVVETRIVSVVVYVVRSVAAQRGAFEGHPVRVAVRVEKMLEVVSVIIGATVAVADTAVTGQTVVETRTVSVVTTVV